jgi:DNA-binding response OmpR family regulator
MAKKILVVDNEPEIVEFLIVRLSNLGYEVITAGDGKTALEKTRSSSPDLIIMDVNMPPPNGFQACRILKDDKDLKRIPVILLTSKSTDSDKFWGIESGADAYETKPYHFPSLLKRIQALLNE